MNQSEPWEPLAKRLREASGTGLLQAVKNLVKNVVKNVVRNLVKNLVKNLVNIWFEKILKNFGTKIWSKIWTKEYGPNCLNTVQFSFDLFQISLR